MTALEGDFAEAPLVVQYNHRDAPDAVSVPVLREALEVDRPRRRAQGGRKRQADRVPRAAKGS